MRAAGFFLMMIAASGIDAPDPTANYILLVVALVMMMIGNIRAKG